MAFVALGNRLPCASLIVTNFSLVSRQFEKVFRILFSGPFYPLQIVQVGKGPWGRVPCEFLVTRSHFPEQFQNPPKFYHSFVCLPLSQL